MNAHDLIALVDRLRALPTETEWLEFKRNNADPQEVGEYLSALANGASLGNQPRGYLVFGIDDTTHAVVGTGEAGRHIRERGFDKRYYLDLILAVVREHAPASRREIDQAVISKLPDRLTQEQKQRKVHNLLQELRRAGTIDNQGSRGQPAWFSTDVSADG